MTRLSDHCWIALGSIVLLGLVLHVQVLGWGFFIDDYGILLTLEGGGRKGVGPASLYDVGELSAFDERLYGIVSPPWWTDPGWKLRFFRPVSSLALALDHFLWGRNALGWHLDGLLWYALLLAACYGLYRALGLNVPVALGAVLFLTLDDSSLLPVGWIANRNAVVEAFFTVLSLWALASHERLGRSCASVLALSAAAVAMGAKESGIALAVLIPAYLLLVPGGGGAGPGGVRGRCGTTLALAVALGIAYLAFLLGAGYGSTSLFYPTPWGQPAEWLERLPVLLCSSALAATTPASLDAIVMRPETEPLFIGLGALIAVFLGRVLWRELRAHPSTRFLFAWLLLTLLPRAGVPPADRLLFVPGVASAALFAQLVAAAPRPLIRNLSRSSAARWAAYLVVVAGLLSGLSLWLKHGVLLHLIEETRSVVRDAEVPSPELGRRDVLFLQLPNAASGLMPGAVRAFESADIDLNFWSLQFGRRGLALERTGPRTLVVTSRDEPFGVHRYEWLFRTIPRPMTAGGGGRRYRSPIFEAVVLEPEGEGARSFRMELNRNWDDPTLQLATWVEGRMRRVEPPRVGEVLELEAISPPMPLWP